MKKWKFLFEEFIFFLIEILYVNLKTEKFKVCKHTKMSDFEVWKMFYKIIHSFFVEFRRNSYKKLMSCNLNFNTFNTDPGHGAPSSSNFM